MNKEYILEKQTSFLQDRLKNDVKGKTSLHDFYRAISRSLHDLLQMAFKPSFKAKESWKFDRVEQGEELSHICLDLDIINDSVSNINDTIAANFNDMQVFKNRAKNLLGKAQDALQTLSFVTNNTDYYVFHDTFTDYSKIDDQLSKLNEINVMTTEGILTLPITKEQRREYKVGLTTYTSPNGTIGNYGVVEKAYGGESIYFLSDVNAKDNIDDLTDNQPNTWVEFQGTGDTLDISISFRFNSETDLNWISLDPYIPPRSEHTFRVTSIQYRDKESVAFKEVNIKHKDKEVLLAISDAQGNKFEHQGVYLFEPIVVTEIVIKLSTDKEFLDKIGRYQYNLYSNGVLVEQDIGSERAQQLVSNITKNTLTGIFNVNASTEEQIEKKLMVYEQYRKVIGLRDVKFRMLTFEKTTEVFSVRYSMPEDISEVKLHTVESVNGLESYDKYISYFISFDDNEWLPIRPSNQLFGNIDSPIAYHINSADSEDMKTFNQNIGYIDGKYRDIRLKIVMQSQSEHLSPVLEQYALMCKTDKGRNSI